MGRFDLVLLGFAIGCAFAAWSLYSRIEGCKDAHSVDRCYVEVTLTNLEIEP